MPADWSFRAAAMADFEPLLDLRLRVMRPALERIGRFDPDRARRYFGEGFDLDWMRVIVVESAIAGCVCFRREDEHWVIEYFYLEPRFHRSGLGSSILRALLAQADRSGRVVRLEVVKGSESAHLYERHGFTRYGEGEWDFYYERSLPPPFERVCALLDAAGARYRLIEHEPEGRSERISVMRGNRPEQAAKAMVLDVRGGGGGRRHVLAILPGNRKLDFAAVAALLGARKCGFASPETAQAITGCVMGAVPPFALHDTLSVVVDQALLSNRTLFFNAGRLDRSMELDTADWLRVVGPKVATIAS
jgi:Ala-tRNA(Pro) deacylase